ncbi:MAG: EFR1 family ferrodoxin [Oscillospiraceae bacterium]|nr:EFR1 family ferrodoxin [Oscillospiraceae bacterium]
MITLYFSGTGNTKYVSELFSQKMDAKCFSIEEDVDFSAEIRTHDTIAFCYPIYGSRVPHIMRAFVHKHKSDIIGKKIVILATQQAFSGDGARVFADLFEDGKIKVIYAEHFNMQQNMGNIPVWSALFTPSEKSMKKENRKTDAKMNIVCYNIKNGIVKKRGFNKISVILGYIQGKPWQRKTNEITPTRLEKKVIGNLRIHEDCNACNLCVDICPAKNLVYQAKEIEHLNNCTVCYRCVNRCPQKAITVYIHREPKWQYFRD